MGQLVCRYAVAETIEDINARIARIGVATAGLYKLNAVAPQLETAWFHNP
jgi:hypothetical protein